MTNAALLTTSWQVSGLLFLRFSVMDTHFLICLPCTAYTAVQKWYSFHFWTVHVMLHDALLKMYSMFLQKVGTHCKVS